MKKLTTLLLSLSMAVLTATSQNIKEIRLDFGDDISTALGDGKYEIDSLVITGNISHSAFSAIRDCIENGKLTGIDMHGCRVEEDSIPDGGLLIGKSFEYRNEHCIKGLTLPSSLRAIGEHALAHLYVTGIELPSSLRIIGARAFEGCQQMKGTVRIPEGVETIGRGAFYDCHKIEHVEFPASLRTIGDFAFCGTFALKELNFNDGLLTVGKGAFYRSSYDIKEIVFPESVEEIGDMAFYTEMDLDRLVLPPNIREIKEYTFMSCSAKEIVWPKALERMDDYAFSNFLGEDLFLPEGLVTMSNNTFFDIYNVKRLVLPASISRIGVNTFTNVSSLKEMYVKCPFPPESPVNNENYGSDYGWFNNLPDDAVLYVPVGSVEAYRCCEMFSKFKTIKETDKFPSGITEHPKYSISVPKGTSIYTLDGRYLGSDIKALKSGVYVINGKKVVK